ncbi:MAG TPA: ABC transporter ATP-binding protein [Anaerohalosphaeraceae bacterium]|jgi:lipoprotein-releasing system ATP-binding protein|nr:ABC transporter ATP-binding protein [Anaerohalosphaeraceae bacterium]HRT50650.1 ABC transporter ATP-binding protein [Anaerohalosphaeraceae bacterium]HRT86525.1 ABC transporter ATP-binding protein [Anaerohalosphaeraceae bacterium]
MLELVHVAKTYGSPDSPERVEVLKDVSLDLRPGEAIAIVGPSGCGKSTLLNIMGALDKPTSGKVLLDGQDLASLDEAELAVIRNRKIGFVFQMHHLLSQCTVLENVLIPTLALPGGKPGEEVRQRAIQLLETVGLKDRLNYRPGELSGGQRQRVAVVRALINKPSLLLADEPTGSLDRETSGSIIDLLIELNLRQRVALVVVTHSMRLADSMGRILELYDGVLEDASE